MKISNSLNVFTEGPIEDAIRRVKEAGFDTLDFNYWDYQGYVLGLTPEEEITWAKDIRAAADKFEIPFTQMHGPVHGSSFSSMVQGLNEESFIELAKRSLHTAEILGVSWVVFHPGNLSVLGQEPHEEIVARNVQFYQKLIPTMEKTGVGIALENIFDRTTGIGAKGDLDRARRCYGALPQDLTELIDRLDHPLVGACWDTGHGHKQGLRQGESIRMLGSRLKALHIQDNNGMWDQHLLPYQGSIDWNDVMTALKDIGFSYDFTYEAHVPIRSLPESLKDDGLRYAAQIARQLVSYNLHPIDLK